MHCEIQGKDAVLTSDGYVLSIEHRDDDFLVIRLGPVLTTTTRRDPSAVARRLKTKLNLLEQIEKEQKEKWGGLATTFIYGGRVHVELPEEHGRVLHFEVTPSRRIVRVKLVRRLRNWL
ncbi:MAG: hypothetical protein QXI02_04090 [Candidatus Caldarchaeum sp.]